MITKVVRGSALFLSVVGRPTAPVQKFTPKRLCGRILEVAVTIASGKRDGGNIFPQIILHAEWKEADIGWIQFTGEGFNEIVPVERF